MKGIFSVLVENKAGVLSKTAGLFARRGFNIDSLAVGETDDRDISSMTIISTGDERIMEQIEKQLNKKIDVIKVRRFAENKCVTRELLMLRDLSPKSMVIELTAKTSKIDRFIKLMQPFGIIEMARTGALAVQRDSNE